MKTGIGRFAETFARFMGTARFLMYMTVFVVIWVALNVVGPSDLRWDPYPFILLNLFFSAQASYAAPLILLAQNRQEERDRVLAPDRARATATRADMEFLAREVARSGWRSARSPPATSSAPNCAASSTSSTDREEETSRPPDGALSLRGQTWRCATMSPRRSSRPRGARHGQGPRDHRPITELGMVEDVAIERTAGSGQVLLTVSGCPLKERLTRDVTGPSARSPA